MKKISLILLLLLLCITTIGSVPYSDEPSIWAEESVETLKETNLFNDERFVDYQDNITREDFIYWAVTLYEILQNEEIKVDPSISFSDTSNEYALKAATVGITSGVGDSKFAPNQLLDRQTMVTFFVKIMNLGQMDLLDASNDRFTDDADIEDWAKPYVYTSRSNNIVSGVGNNKFDAKGLATSEVCMILTKKVLFESQGKSFTVDGHKKVIGMEPVVPKVVVIDDNLNHNGKEDFAPENDSVATPSDLKAFEEKYGLGGYVKSQKIPTKYDLNPSLHAGDGSNRLWDREVSMAYAKNPPTLIGKDGSLPPYEATTDVFIQWIKDNDIYMAGNNTQASGKYGGKTPSQYDLEGGTYYYGRLALWGGYETNNLYMYDGELNPYELYSIDARIHNKLWRPVNQVYTRMLLIHYLGEEEGEKAYQFFNNGWDGTEDVQFAVAYKFGDREIMFIGLSPQGVSLHLGEPNYVFADYYKEIPGYRFNGTIYNDPFDDNYKPF